MWQKKLSQWKFVRLASQNHRFSYFWSHASFLSHDLWIFFSVVPFIITSSMEGVVQDLNPKGTPLELGDTDSHTTKYWILQKGQTFIITVVILVKWRIDRNNCPKT